MPRRRCAHTLPLACDLYISYRLGNDVDQNMPQRQCKRPVFLSTRLMSPGNSCSTRSHCDIFNSGGTMLRLHSPDKLAWRGRICRGNTGLIPSSARLCSVTCALFASFKSSARELCPAMVPCVHKFANAILYIYICTTYRTFLLVVSTNPL